MVQVNVLFHTDEIIFVWFFKNGNGRQNRSSGAKTGLLRATGGCQNLVPGWHSKRHVGGRCGLSIIYSHIYTHIFEINCKNVILKSHKKAPFLNVLKVNYQIKCFSVPVTIRILTLPVILSFMKFYVAFLSNLFSRFLVVE